MNILNNLFSGLVFTSNYTKISTVFAAVFIVSTREFYNDHKQKIKAVFTLCG